MPSLSRSIGLAVTASALVLLTACGGGGAPDAAQGTAVADPVVTFPPLTRTASAAPTTEAQAPATETVVVTKTVQDSEATTVGGPFRVPLVDSERFRIEGSQSGHDFGFVTPTGNVACSISAVGAITDSVACQAKDTVAPDNGSTCTAPETATRIYASGPTSRYECARPDETVEAPGANVLNYGTAIDVGSIHCLSDFERGVTCITGAAGIRLSRDVNEAF
ncbi:hypothetical protein GCM10007304_06210 [Rhodococcoides trifolii]|uniref:Lipoprotein n=1 Tax=Rhodococcoides trifolii TaxID=908250 RepID=A0A917FQQ6_9NOCA|nr:hypothetical protein [Rhodococcus trifolii]GGF95142.1 hypothetical protein GCM10007304_06210 [Rhodococcus trifolii]